MLPLVIFLTCFIGNGESTPRPFYHPAMCEFKGSINCSFQLPDSKNSFCKVYNTSECRNFDFSGWTRQTSKYPTSQSDSICVVDISPYALSNAQGLPGSKDAINITLATLDKDVDGYVLLLENSDANLNICRIFDFRNSDSRSNVNLFYDCLFGFVNHYAVYNFDLKVRVLPHNEEMLYTLYLPSASAIEANDICQWKPLVMVFNGGFQNNVVEVKFSQAPKYLSISSYEVGLLSTTSGVPEQKTIVKASEGALLSSVFSHVDRGFYSIYVQPSSSDSAHRCGTTTYTVFFVENKIIDIIIISYVLAICCAGFLVTITVLLFLRWLSKPGPITPKPVALFVYSFDCKEHDMAVLRFAKFLKKQSGMEVLTIYGEQSSDPEMWLYRPYANCDVVIIIISEGVFHKYENRNNPPMKEGYPCGDRLVFSLSFLREKMMSHEKKFIQVYFEYSGTCHTPKFMQLARRETAFVIPREMNRLLCQVYNQSPKISCLGVFPRMPGHDVISYPEGIALIDKIEEMKQVLNKNPNVLKTWNELASKQDTLSTAEIDNYNNEHVGDEENYAHSHLLKYDEPCPVEEYKVDHECTEQLSTDRHLQDLEYILSKPGPSFPYFDSLKLKK